VGLAVEIFLLLNWTSFETIKSVECRHSLFRLELEFVLRFEARRIIYSSSRSPIQGLSATYFSSPLSPPILTSDDQTFPVILSVGHT